MKQDNRKFVKYWFIEPRTSKNKNGMDPILSRQVYDHCDIEIKKNMMYTNAIQRVDVILGDYVMDIYFVIDMNKQYYWIVSQKRGRKYK